MSTWVEEWAATGASAQARAAASVCDRCGTVKAVGYSNMGIPIVVCPKCSPSLVENGKLSVGEAWGFRERA
jgi:hypothetical protein